MTDERPVPNRDGPPRVTMIGGGQLARMTHQAAIELGQSLRVLAASPEDPAAQVCADVVLGSHDSLDDLRRAADGSHAVTFDHEGVPTEHLVALQDEGVVVHPPPQALLYAQDKLAMRRRLRELGAPGPDFAEIASEDDVRAFWARVDGAIVLKAVRGGYDGRGVWLPDTLGEAVEVARDQLAAGVPLMAEEKVEWVRELSAMVARSPFGQGATWPVVETVQRNGQCAVVLAPAPGLDSVAAERAEALALTISRELGVVGVMAVELFETEDGGLVVNELAMRPHNSGHWTQDGCVTSQFEQHLRAVLDYPLGGTAPRAPITVMANILGAAERPEMSMDERLHHLMARMPDAKVHLYGKGERPDRKVGHVNIVGGEIGDATDAPTEGAYDEYVAAVRERAERAATWMSTAEWTDGWSEHG
ncbi:5-(carboxyamino)imidazole ribonucleotide synthase [Tsukamurella sp. 8F]|uniref:5-(carboxyamino)imidazole ribonucleotide synthase n=1 Tax=unclassified Tsukamurella TaxID=2633480 RepID=UPI0023BA38F9|nr:MULTISPECIES: 5-(carboxyamino)imidazole ribonucleotide synthase [unclassified Tsukamurella]MDF0529017.1 5-(carboxyamino)imidazole ribonucleotide synthase [Tsukamurella sp. 8J]MDF0587390.1 5-(carboxyamino)imidazole ribonucleotide synthase [Tsukamurella sp. 8F]